VRQRWQSAGDVRIELESVLADPGGLLAEPSGHAVGAPLSLRQLLTRGWAPGLVLVAVAAIAGVYVGQWLYPEARPVVRFERPLPDGREFMALGRGVAALSPDGTRFVYHADGLHLGAMDALETRPIPGTSGALANPFFSHDGEWIAFATGNQITGAGRLVKVAVTGGNPVELAKIGPIFGASWSADDTMLYGQADGIWLVSADPDDGAPGRVIETGPGEQAYGPQLLPGGEWVLFSLARGTSASRWDEAEIVAQSLVSGERRPVWRGGSDARYVPTGHLLYASGLALFAVPFDVDLLAHAGFKLHHVEPERAIAVHDDDVALR
jgi:hypothetical protein